MGCLPRLTRPAGGHGPGASLRPGKAGAGCRMRSEAETRDQDACVRDSFEKKSYTKD